MYIVRDIFQLKFGHYRAVKALMDEAKQKNMMPSSKSTRFLTDFTGNAYRFIFENEYDSLSDYEKAMAGGMSETDWQEWYKRFSEHVEGSHREILKLVK
jgi:hypothetical protein